MRLKPSLACFFGRDIHTYIRTYEHTCILWFSAFIPLQAQGPIPSNSTFYILCTCFSLIQYITMYLNCHNTMITLVWQAQVREPPGEPPGAGSSLRASVLALRPIKFSWRPWEFAGIKFRCWWSGNGSLLLRRPFDRLHYAMLYYTLIYYTMICYTILLYYTMTARCSACGSTSRTSTSRQPRYNLSLMLVLLLLSLVCVCVCLCYTCYHYSCVS